MKYIIAFALITLSFSANAANECPNNQNALTEAQAGVERFSANEAKPDYWDNEAQRNDILNSVNNGLTKAKTECDAEIAQLKKPLPKLGWSSKQVRASRLGDPVQVNRTVTVNYSHEQWVYPNGLYLYFNNGRLTGFQD